MTATLQIKKDRPNYYILIRYKDDVIGKERQKWITTDISIKGNNKRRAEIELKKVVAEFESNRVDLGRDILFIEFYRLWLTNLKHSIAPSTYEGYCLILKTHITPYFEVKKIKLKDLMPTHIQHYINEKIKNLSPNTITKHLHNISKCLDSAVKQNLIAFNPVKRIDMPKKEKYTGAQHYNEKQIEQLLECSKDDPLEIVILLSIFYGLRRSEVLGLKWEAIDFKNCTITIKHTVTRLDKTLLKMDATKNDSSYAVIPMPKSISGRLKRWKIQQMENRLLQPNDYIDEGYVCTQFDGSLIKPGFVSKHFSLLLNQNGMPHIRFHDLRHSSACYLLYLGFNLKEIQEWLRHKDIQTTMNIYARLNLEAKSNIAESIEKRLSNFIS